MVSWNYAENFFINIFSNWFRCYTVNFPSSFSGRLPEISSKVPRISCRIYFRNVTGNSPKMSSKVLARTLLGVPIGIDPAVSPRILPADPRAISPEVTVAILIEFPVGIPPGSPLGVLQKVHLGVSAENSSSSAAASSSRSSGRISSGSFILKFSRSFMGSSKAFVGNSYRSWIGKHSRTKNSSTSYRRSWIHREFLEFPGILPKVPTKTPMRFPPEIPLVIILEVLPRISVEL